MIDADDLAAWLRLIETPRVGRESARRLLAAFGSPQAALAAAAAARREVIGAAPANRLSAPPEGFEALLARTTDWLRADARREIVVLGDPRYPTRLLESPDPPLLLYVQGRVELLGAASVAIVGSRHATRQGLDNARSFAAQLGRDGLVIVSGLALGIDAAAHAGALDAGAATIAVVGTGLDQTYPARHRELAQRIVESGAIVSEYSLGTPPLPPNFPTRNRIIAGLTLGTLVVEATQQSGSLITARLASEAGREVFAVPGSIHAPQSRGCHDLIRQGAKLVESAKDVLEELQLPGADSGHPRSSQSEPAASPAEAGLLDALGYDPVTLDALVARTGCSPAELNVRLLELELDGRVARLPGQLFQRLARG